ncbi:DUF1349 domain-containing protein [Herbiconiux liukaitaii]|uniref:DUF1349 domain-containing protein n=1 Tax=Herbiconiux liukaitaii TaxID=3342799 RepID=UPI0035BB334C
MGLTELIESGRWTTPPVSTTFDGEALRVVAAEGSDAWLTTSYGFVHDTEHALLEEFGPEDAVEVSFVLDYDRQFDQAGILLRVSETEWIKAGVEVSDGVLQVGAVVTHGFSDWSVAPVPDWRGRIVTVRASRSGDAVTVRAKAEGEEFRLVRVAYLSPTAVVTAGLFCCGPTRPGLEVTFTSHTRTPPDDALHP